VDSAGVALLAELAARIAPAPGVLGEPEGFQALCAAYRLGPTLAFT
jgi:ABC-type transporter Mla MlaB component